MFARGIEITRLVVLTKGSGMSVGLHGRVLRGGGQSSRIGHHAGDGARGSSQRRGEERSPALALAPLEVAVRGADAVLAGLQLIAVHGNAHRAAGLAPLGAGRAEDLIEALALSLLLNLLRSWDHEHSQPVRYLPPAQNRGRGPQVLDAAVRARSDEDNVEILAVDRSPRLQA